MQRTVHEHLREHLWIRARREARLPYEHTPWLPDLEQLKQTQWCPWFEQAMRNRLLMGGIRHGLSFGDAEPGKATWDRITDMAKRLGRYKDDGNIEHLVDLANLAMLEAEEGDHPLRHFRARDDSGHAEVKRP